MISSIHIKNFKSIKDFSFNLKSLNIVMGLNGMGKSTFIQSMLLLRQSNKLQNGELQLNGEFIKIGTTRDAQYQYSKEENFSITIDFKDAKKLFECDYVIESDVFKFEDLTFPSSFFTQSLFSTNFQYLSASRLDPTSLHVKSYSSVITDNNIGNIGEYTSHFIEVYGNEDIHFDSMLHQDSRTVDASTGKEIINKTLINQINLWMGEISPGINIKTTSIPNSDYVLLEYVYKQPNLGSTNRFKPGNVGFGISYVLPVVTALLSARPGKLLIIENPESHIHPRGQAELGRLIALAALNDVQIVVETHSDHVLNGIRVATKMTEKLNEKVSLFYFEKEINESEQYSKITRINIDKYGELSDYPQNLSDEWSNQLLKLL